MTSYEGFDSQRIKHLEMIQAVIGRLGNDSFLVKGWAVTVAGAFFGFAVNADDWKLAVASVLPTVAFWGLDTYFLRSERLFRALYDHVRRGTGRVEPFFMAATSGAFTGVLAEGPDQALSSWRKTFWRPTLAVFYGALVASALVVILVVCLD